MQKLEKKQYIKKPVFRNSKKIINKVKSQKSFFYRRKQIKNAFYVLKKLNLKWYRVSFYQLLTKKKFKTFSKCLNIKVTSNNIFCNFKNRLTNQTLAVGSSGKYKIKTTRKKLRYAIKLVLRSFMMEVTSKFTLKTLIIKIVAPIKIRRHIVSFLSEVLKNKTQKLIIKIAHKKCFNGCRPAKKKRKKQKGLRIFK
jgi:ribosomal protein S11